MAEPGSAREWALALYGRSVLKQRKVSELTRALGPTAGLRCLDLGSDNGVVSLLLRERGGAWASADLTTQAVESIRSLVGSDVHLVDAGRLPFGTPSSIASPSWTCSSTRPTRRRSRASSRGSRSPAAA